MEDLLVAPVLVTVLVYGSWITFKDNPIALLWISIYVIIVPVKLFFFGLG